MMLRRVGPGAVGGRVLAAGCAARGFARGEVRRGRERNRRVAMRLCAPAE